MGDDLLPRLGAQCFGGSRHGLWPGVEHSPGSMRHCARVRPSTLPVAGREPPNLTIPIGPIPYATHLSSARLLLMPAPDTAQAEGSSGYTPAALLELRRVSKRYPGQAKPAIAELSLEVPAGEVCVLVGPSGSGKTTAMRLINRMIEPSSGDIVLGGRSVLDRRPDELRRHIGYVIQQVGLFPHQTIAENIATVPRLLGWDKARIARRTNELLELVGLDPDEMRGRYPVQLSGGQQQRIGVARALAADPPLMLMDEPFGAIDPINRERLQDEFLRLQATVRKTIVFVTHDIDEAIKMGDRIAILREGGVLAQYASPVELLSRPATSSSPSSSAPTGHSSG